MRREPAEPSSAGPDPHTIIDGPSSSDSMPDAHVESATGSSYGECRPDPIPSRNSRPDRHVMSAAAVVFSFGGLQAKLGRPLSFLHAPVPGFQSDLAHLVNRTLDGLQPSRPVWRSNWSLVENGELDDPAHHSYSTPEAAAQLVAAPLVPPESRWLKVRRVGGAGRRAADRQVRRVLLASLGEVAGQAEPCTFTIFISRLSTRPCGGCPAHVASSSQCAPWWSP